MKKYTLILFLVLFFTKNVLANIEKGKWNFVKEEDYCYIGSAPTASIIPEGKKRGDVYILVYRINKNKEAIIQINAGYPYKNKDSIEVKVDKNNYKFFTKDDNAWTNNDEEVVYAMKKGVVLEVTGISKRDTKTLDTYTLNGFTSAYNKLTKDC